MADLTSPLKPSRSYGFLSLAVIAVAAILALVAAWAALVAIERTSRNAVEHALFLSGEDWTQVEVNGLQVILSGDAPSEAARFAALSAAAHEVDGARVIDQMALPETVAIEPPRFSIEMLRNEAGISLIGLIPAETDREALTRRIGAIDPVQPVADFLETADFPTPEGWQDALDFALVVAGMVPRSKISVDADHVAVEAIATSPDEKREWEQAIRRERPAGLRLALDIRAPLDVISPYIVRFLSDEQGARFDACTAYTPADRNKIVSAGIAAGVKGAIDCTIGLGVPSPDWPDAVARGIRAVRELGGGSLTFSDADVTLIAPPQTPQDSFDRVVGELEADLPDVFSLHAVLPEAETGPVSPAGPPEFIATLGEDGAVQLRGRVASEQDRTIAETLARAQFGTEKVYAPLRLDPALPASWSVRTLAGLQALDRLAEGQVVVRPSVVTVTGDTGEKGASAEISRLLSEKLGEAEDFRVNVTYEEALDPVAAMPTPQECVADVNAALAKNKINFAPGSAEIERSSLSTVDRIAEILKACPDVAMEIAGYTDSQGREEMNQALSQRRAEAVVSALLARRVLTTNLTAFGYGEDNPIADNDTEEGREANRRIEFSLIGEDLPRALVAQGDAPTIRPPARPGAEATGDGGKAGAADPAAEGGDETAAATPDGATGSTMQNDGGEAVTEGSGEPAPEMPDTPDTPESPDAAVDNGAADATGAAEPGGDAAPPSAEDPEAAPDTGAVVVDDETRPGAAENTDAAGADAQPAVDAETAVDAAEVTTEGTGAGPGEDAVEDSGDTSGNGSGSDSAETVEEPANATSDRAAAPAVAARADPEADRMPEADAVLTPEAAADLAEDPGQAADATGTEPQADPAKGGPSAPDTAAADSTTGATVAETTDAAEDGAVTAAVEAEPAAGRPEELATPAAPAAPVMTDVAGTADAGEAAEGGGDDAVGVVEMAGEVVPGAGALAAAPDPAGAAGMADPTNAGAPDAAGDPALSAAAGAPTLDIPAIRPRARPPLVVHPDLEGVRPRPRPANIPDAPTTE